MDFGDQLVGVGGDDRKGSNLARGPALSSSPRCPAIPNGEPFHRDWRTEGSAALDDSPAHARDIVIRLRSFKGLRRLTRSLACTCPRVRSARGSQARLLVRLSFDPRIGGKRMVTGRNVPRIVSWGVTSVGGEPAGRGCTYTDMVNELLPSVSSRRWWFVRRTGNEIERPDERRRREMRKRDDRRSLAIG
jgi:hypothetical protein